MSGNSEARIKAYLNLSAVLQNLEELVRLDKDMAGLSAPWRETLQFTVKDGPAAHVTFNEGGCVHGLGRHDTPSIKLYFRSPAHLNAMFDGKGTPWLTKGFLKIGFLKNGFTQLTDRLETYLKPAPERFEDADFRAANTVLTFYTALFAAAGLATTDEVSRELAAHAGQGQLEVAILPDGPTAHLVFEQGHVRAFKGPAPKARARMLFKDMEVAHALLNNQLDGFQAVAHGDVTLQGHVPMVDNTNLILDRVRLFLE